MNTSKIPEAIPGTLSGRVTRRKAFVLEAPSDMAARLRFLSMLRSTL